MCICLVCLCVCACVLFVLVYVHVSCWFVCMRMCLVCVYICAFVGLSIPPCLAFIFYFSGLLFPRLISYYPARSRDISFDLLSFHFSLAVSRHISYSFILPLLFLSIYLSISFIFLSIYLFTDLSFSRLFPPFVSQYLVGSRALTLPIPRDLVESRVLFPSTRSRVVSCDLVFCGSKPPSRVLLRYHMLFLLI